MLSIASDLWFYGNWKGRATAMRYVLLVVVALMLVSSSGVSAAVQPVHVLYMDGHIDPTMANYISEGIKEAERESAQAVLILMDTPGGLMTSMQQIVRSFFAARVPVIVYVYPDGATATSAGTFIAMAADIAAMSPASTIGSASPVSIGSSGESEEMDETMKRKVTNFAVEYAKSIAEKRGRNEQWAEKAVREGANLKASDALKQKVVDIIAKDIPGLMDKVDGETIKLSTGKTVTLNTADAPLEERPMGPWEKFLHYLSHPYVAMFLSLIALYGIIYELSNPGAILPGVLGGIAILLLLYSFSVIPVNAAGFAFIAFAIILFIAEFFVPGTGILTAGGVISMFIGLMMLFRASEGFMVPIWLLVAVSLLTGGFFLFVVGVGLRALKNPYVSGREGVVGRIGEARTNLDPTGKVFVDGTMWTATSEDGLIEKGEKVKVRAMTGLKLTVQKYIE